MPRYVVARKLSLLNGDFIITDQDTGRGCFRVHGKGLLVVTIEAIQQQEYG